MARPPQGGAPRPVGGGGAAGGGAVAFGKS